MTVAAALAVLLLAVPAADLTPSIVQAPDSPVRIDRAKVLNAGSEEPAVLLYSATNTTEQDLEHFTVIAFIFDAEGTLKARQVAPARHMLEKRTTKYSAMVLDGWRVTPTDRVVIGVNQAQRLGSDAWWHAELENAAKEAVTKKQGSGGLQAACERFAEKTKCHARSRALSFRRVRARSAIAARPIPSRLNVAGSGIGAGSPKS